MAPGHPPTFAPSHLPWGGQSLCACVCVCECVNLKEGKHEGGRGGGFWGWAPGQGFDITSFACVGLRWAGQVAPRREMTSLTVRWTSSDEEN